MSVDNQHFVPQTYLRGFCFNLEQNKKKKHKQQLYCNNIQNNNIWAIKKIKDAASREHFYEIDIEDRLVFIELFFSLLVEVDLPDVQQFYNSFTSINNSIKIEIVKNLSKENRVYCFDEIFKPDLKSKLFNALANLQDIFPQGIENISFDGKSLLFDGLLEKSYPVLFNALIQHRKDGLDFTHLTTRDINNIWSSLGKIGFNNTLLNRIFEFNSLENQFNIGFENYWPSIKNSFTQQTSGEKTKHKEIVEHIIVQYMRLPNIHSKIDTFIKRNVITQDGFEFQLSASFYHSYFLMSELFQGRSTDWIKLQNKLLKSDFTVYKSSTLSFITSDNPVLFMNEAKNIPVSALDASNVLFPLDANNFLTLENIGQKDKPQLIHKECVESDVVQLNGIINQFAQKMLFSKHKLDTIHYTTTR